MEQYIVLTAGSRRQRLIWSVLVVMMLDGVEENLVAEDFADLNMPGMVVMKAVRRSLRTKWEAKDHNGTSGWK